MRRLWNCPSVACVALIVVAACETDGLTIDGEGTARLIGPEGGKISYGNLTIDIPAGALPSAVEIRIYPGDGHLPPSIGPAYRVAPELTLATAAIITYDYAHVDISAYNELMLAIGGYTGRRFASLETTDLDVHRRRVQGQSTLVASAYALLEGGTIFGDTTGADTSTSTGFDSTGTTGYVTTGDTTASSATATGTGSTTLHGSTSLGTTTAETTDTTAAETTRGPGCGDGLRSAGEVCFVPAPVLAVGTGPAAVALADLNGGGALDLAIAHGVDNTVGIRFGAGDGSFGLESVYEVGASPAALASGRFNSDSNLDLVTANRDDGTVSLLAGTGAGAFAAAVHFTVGNLPQAVTVADFNEDLVDDLVTANSAANDLSLLLSDGSGFLAATSIAGASSPRAVRQGDFTGDLNLDVASLGSGSLALNGGNGAGLFGTPASYAVPGEPRDFVVGLFNSDSYLDIAVTITDMDRVTTAMGNGVGGFGPSVPFATCDGPQSLICADVSGDDVDDLLVLCPSVATLSVLVGDGIGSFTPQVDYPVGNSASDLTVGDINGDLVPDIVVANTADDTVTILLSNP